MWHFCVISRRPEEWAQLRGLQSGLPVQHRGADLHRKQLPPARGRCSRLPARRSARWGGARPSGRSGLLSGLQPGPEPDLSGSIDPLEEQQCCAGVWKSTLRHIDTDHLSLILLNNFQTSPHVSFLIDPLEAHSCRENCICFLFVFFCSIFFKIDILLVLNNMHWWKMKKKCFSLNEISILKRESKREQKSQFKVFEWPNWIFFYLV